MAIEPRRNGQLQAACAHRSAGFPARFHRRVSFSFGRSVTRKTPCAFYITTDRRKALVEIVFHGREERFRTLFARPPLPFSGRRAFFYHGNVCQVHARGTTFRRIAISSASNCSLPFYSMTVSILLTRKRRDTWRIENYRGFSEFHSSRVYLYSQMYRPLSLVIN